MTITGSDFRVRTKEMIIVGLSGIIMDKETKAMDNPMMFMDCSTIRMDKEVVCVD